MNTYYGIQKLSMTDYPGKLAATVFLPGCNFRCVYCHNPDVVYDANHGVNYTLADLNEFLANRYTLLDALVISGGEPTCLPEFVSSISMLVRTTYPNLALKLDTNGSRPDTLRHLNDDFHYDYIAMDVKHAPELYQTVTPMYDIDHIRSSIDYIRTNAKDYEFRTTLVHGIHSAENIVGLGKLVSDSRVLYLQNYVDPPETVSGKHYTGCTKDEIVAIRDTLSSYVPIVLRGNAKELVEE